MKRWLLFLLLLFSTLPVFAQLQVTNNPTGAAVVVTQPSAVLITWIVQSGATTDTTVVSEEGLFVLGNETLGRVETFLTTNVAPGGTSLVTETLLIPPDIPNRVLNQNVPLFLYQRTFRSMTDNASAQAQLTCRLSTSAYGNFSIGGLTLFFENQRGETTFEQNDRTAHAFAEVHYNGTGLLKATWEVHEPNSSDFRVLQQVQYHLTFGDRLVFETPSVPPLPTIVTGRHTLRFRIEQPVSGFQLPQITYFVKSAAPPEEKLPPLTLRNPEEGARLKGNELFEWSGKVDAAILKFSVFEKIAGQKILRDSPSIEPLPDSKKITDSPILQSSDLLLHKGAEIFSAALPTSSTSFRLKKEQISRLQSGKWYLWQIQALDASGKIIAETGLRSFQFAGQP